MEGMDPSTLNRHGPWRCSSCDGISKKVYRCEQCGHPFEGDETTAGMQDTPSGGGE